MLLFIDIKLRVVINISIYIMRIAICIIYVHDAVDVSAYEYVNVYADGYANISIYWYMYV